jgi:PAS domain S-box-containing protein
MIKESFHRLLKRQLKDHFGGLDTVPSELKSFLESVNAAYFEYDKDLDNAERILRESSQELFKSNKELRLLNERNEQIIREKTKDIRKTTYHLQNAEQVTGLGIFSWNITSGRLELSSFFSKLYGIREEDLNNDIQKLYDLFEYPEIIREAVNRSIKNQEKFKLNNIHFKNDNRFYDLEGNVAFFAETEESVLTGVLRDITAEKLREHELDELLNSLEQYKNAIDNSGIVSVTDAKGLITYVNQKFCSISQYSEQELIGASHSIINSGFHTREFFREMWSTIASGKIWKGEVKNKKKDGTFYWVDSTIVPFSKNGVINQFISIRFDITEKKNVMDRVEQQKNFYEGILNNIPVDIAVFNDKHQYLFLNPYAVKNEERRNFLIGKDDFDYCREFGRDDSTARMRRELFNQAVTLRSTVEFMDSNVNREGKTVYSIRRFFPVNNLKGDLEVMIGFGLDITDKIEQSNRLKDSLEEKEALLGEVHHRVKNNLALVMGLIEMQNSRTDNEFLHQQLTEIQNRISAMSLIHEKLYRSANFSKIDMQEYLHDFVRFLGSFFDKKQLVKQYFDVDPILSSTKRAIPIALIVNELVTNSYKYAFSESGKGDIIISMKREGDFIVLSVSDSGPGIPESKDLTKSNSLGMKLLAIFTKQIKGTYTINSNNGLKISIKFPDEQESLNS